MYLISFLFFLFISFFYFFERTQQRDRWKLDSIWKKPTSRVDVSPRGGIEPHKRKRAPFSPRSRARTRASTAWHMADTDCWRFYSPLSVSLVSWVRLYDDRVLTRRDSYPRFQIRARRASALRIRISPETAAKVRTRNNPGRSLFFRNGREVSFRGIWKDGSLWDKKNIWFASLEGNTMKIKVSRR